MRSNTLNATLKKAVFTVAILLLGAGVSLAQVALTAAPTTSTLSDGQVVPMWGYTCGTVGATCRPLNPNAGSGWSPVLITAPTGGTLTINLTNNLTFGANGVPTSLVIVGQLGGGLGTSGTTDPATAFPHPLQGTTWPVQGGTGPGDAVFTPPDQAGRVRSFAQEVTNGNSASLTWANLKAGTYLIESGTHPSIQGPMGLYGILVVTNTSASPATAYPGVTYGADVPLLLSEIDAVQNRAVDTAVNTTGFVETKKWNGATGECGDPTVHTCYPAAVNFDPRYYLINGAAFDRTQTANSLFATAPPTGVTGTVLVRFVNAGLRMHVPSIVGALTNDSSSGTLKVVSGFSLIAEDGNVLPGNPKVQSEVFLSAGKTYDVLINAPANAAPALPVFDRQLSLSTNNQRDGGMQAYIGVNGGTLPAAAGLTPIANADSYLLVSGKTLTVSDPGRGVVANDVGVYGVKVLTAPTQGAVTLNSDGTFTYVPNSGTVSDSFEYQANGNALLTATVTLGACTATASCVGAAPTAIADEYTSTIASRLQISPPGVLANDSDPDRHPLTAVLDGAPSGVNLILNPDGSFSATPTTAGTACAPAGSNCFTFSYHAVNSQNTESTSTTVTLTFLGASGLQVTVQDAQTQALIDDYRWIIEEDRTFQVTDTVNTGANVPSLGTSFHTSYMPVVAAGCVGPIACESGQQVLDTNQFSPTYLQHVGAVCDVGNGACRPGTQKTEVNPSQVALDPNKHYYISILPGDGANPFLSGAGGPVPVDPNNPGGAQRPFDLSQDCGVGVCGHGMGGAQIAPQQTNVTVNLAPTPLPTAKIAVYVFQDDWPLNGEIDTGGGIDTLATQETGLGGFEITLQDQAGGFGDSVGQPTYDMFGMPLSNALAGMIDQRTGLDACPISQKTDGLVGMIVTCPHFEADGITPSPLEGQALISNLYPGVYEVVATPGADRIAKGEEWLQTFTIDGTKGVETMVKAGEPAYFQEFGPAGYHAAIGFANPAIINGRQPEICASATAHCTNTVTGRVTTTRISRSPDQRLYSSGSYDANSYTQCYASLGDVDGEDFAFTKCDDQGRFSFSNIPDGTWRVTVFDQWNDLLVDGLSTPIAVSGGVVPMGDIPMQQWRTNIYNRTYIDSNRDGVSQDNEPGLPLVPINVRFRDGSFSNFNSTDLAGFAGFNEVFPFFNWLVVETDTTRYKQTGVHVVYDAGGPADTSGIATGLASSVETNPLPLNLRVPGAVYCGAGDANCATTNRLTNPNGGGPGGSTGRIDPPWVTTEGLQGFIGNAEFIEFGKVPFAENENGGIKGHVIYMSTRPFDDPALLLQLSWTPAVPNVTVNLYQEGTAPDGTKSLKLVDTTKTSSWDEFAQGFRSNGVPNMNCPGQDATSPFFFTLAGSTQWLDPSSPKTTLPNNSQYKCYDGMHMFNQVQPAPYDGMYQFPSIIGRDPQSGAPTGTGIAVNPAGGSRPGSNCTICVANPADQTPMLPAGKYVVEMVVPPGYELVKEEDKNILLGDNYIAPVTQQFGGFGNIFIMPDQAAVASTYNPNNPLNQTTDLGAQPRHEGDTGSIETFWPCVGQARVVPEFVSLFPGSGEVSPFAGATRNLCDRKEVTLEDQMSVLAKFYVFSSTHVAAHFTGIITDDFSSEFDPFSPAFGEKFAVPNLPISFKDFNGVEVSRTSSDQWGFYNGLNFSSWEVNPPSPSGYVPQMMVTCMNDPGPIPGPNGTMITDPLYNSNYSQFCYEWGFMPGQTAYMDTPVIPTTAFAEAYNPVDCAYPNTTPAIKSVIGNDATGATAGSGKGPWVSGSGTGHTLTITALGDQSVANNAYSGPSADGVPFNQKKVSRHYGFGNTAGTVALVGSDGISRPLTGVSWSDTVITGTVPTNVPSCPLLQRGTGTGTVNNRFPANCGELVITAANGKQSIDTVTVTIGGRTPKVVAPGQNIQSVIDASTTAAGDLILVPAGIYNEMLVMWKPLRLQGVGAASVTVNANTHPAGRIDTWRRQVNCLFGLSLNGGSISGQNPFDPTGTFTCAFNGQPQVDPIPLEPLVGWDPTLNGNLAELLQEPTLLGAYEGAGITVVGKGLRNPNTPGVCDALNANGCIQLTTEQCSNNLNSTNPNARSNFLCNPSRIDGMSFVNSSQGGGAIFLHGWNHNTEVSNNRVNSNIGTLTGGITIGQMETPDANIVGTQQQAFGFDRSVNVHHNSITQNASLGDELNSTTPSAAGGVTFCTGSDSYRFNHNWVCGNLSSGDGGGFAHFGLSYNGNISNNWFLFNQSFNPTIPTYGGGVSVMGAPPDGPVCENATRDQDCPPQLSDGIGPGLVIDSNLIQGNTAESGSGGGLRLQSVNGTEVARNPGNPGNWYQVTITNNIIANNVAGWDGGGVSLQDALRVNFINNTVMTNDSTASSGVLFNTHGAANSSTPPPAAGSGNGSGCTPQPDPNQPQDPSCVNPVSTSTNQPAGLVAIRNTANLIASLPNTIICPVGNNSTGDSAGARTNGSCRQVSYPALRNNLFWQNRPFHIEVGGFGSGLLTQQHLVTLVPTLNQAATGTCPSGATYWDIGIRGDTGPTNHSSGFTLGPQNSILTDFFGSYSGNGNIAPTSPGVVSQYCNGSRVPPENGGLGYNVPPGIADAQVPNPVFNLTPAATVDEGNNWINMAYGPLTLSNLSGVTLGDSRICGGPGAPGASCLAPSPAINTAAAAVAPNHDFFGTTRPQNGAFDIGAVEFAGTIVVPPPTRPTPGVLDDFNRANANTLNNGSNWSQLVVLANAGIRVNGNQAFCINTGLAAVLCSTGVPGTAYWNNPTGGFGARQAAAFTFANTTLNGDSLILKATGGTNILGLQANFIRVRYSTATAQVIVETTTNNGGSYTTQGTLSGFGGFASGDTITVLADATGTVYVWKNTTAAPIGAGVTLGAAWTGGGRIGMQLPGGARVDNFAGGTVP